MLKKKSQGFLNRDGQVCPSYLGEKTGPEDAVAAAVVLLRGHPRGCGHVRGAAFVLPP